MGAPGLGSILADGFYGLPSLRPPGPPTGGGSPRGDSRQGPRPGDYPRAAPQLRLVRGNLGRLLDALCAKCHRDPQRLRPWSRLGTKVEVFMTTVIDVIVLLLAYAGLSLSCAGLIWLLRRLPHGHSHEGPTNRAW
jgi:hypothetical protein